MSNKLVDMELDEISLVKKGANQFSTVSIAKSLSSEEEEMEELFDENGDLVDAEELDYGDVVFDSDGNAFEVTPEDDDDDYDGNDDDIEKSVWGAVAGAGKKVSNTGRRAAGKVRRAAFGEGPREAFGDGISRRAASAVDSARYLGTPAGSPVGAARNAVTGATEQGGSAVRRMRNQARAGWNAGASNREIERSIRRGTLPSAARDNMMPGGGSRTRRVFQNVSQNRGRYAAGAAGAGAVGGAGYGAYEYNRRRNVGKSLREEFSKALTDDDRESVISKAMDAISQLEEQNEIALEIAKSEQEQRIFNDYVSIAKTYDLPFEDDVVASAMMEAEANLSEEACAVIAKSFELASNLITQEIGYDELGSDAMYVVDDALDEIGKSGDPEAITQLLENNPELYEAYLAEKKN